MGSNAIAVQVAAAALALGAGAAAAQGSYPSKPVRIVVPYSAGGNVDIVSRSFAQRLGDAFGQQVLVVHPSVPAKTVKEVIALGRASPGQLNAASGGVGTAGHMALELFMVTSGAKFGHVPYKGNAPGLADVVAGQLPLMFDTISTSLPHVKGGKLRGVTVTSPKRSGLLPELPTVAEAALPGFEASVYNLMVGPAGLPRDIAGRLHAELARIVKLPEFRARIDALGIDLIAGPPEELGRFIQSDVEKWAKVVKAAGIKPE